MAGYRKNKFLTAWEIVLRVENWWEAWGLRLSRRAGPGLLRLRGGPHIICRGETRDWDVVQEVFFVGAYSRAMEYLRKLEGSPLVLDLGGNIGLFSLLAAAANPRCRIQAFEPGPPNHAIFEINRLLNPESGTRITLHGEAVGGSTREAEWHFDSANPGGSGFFSKAGSTHTVKMRSFMDIRSGLPERVALLKMDIEGSEYELFESAPAAAWDRVDAIVIELHDDPRGLSSPGAALENFRKWNFVIEPEIAGCYFLHRNQPA